MRILIYNARQYDRDFFTRINQSYNHDISYMDTELGLESVGLSAGYDAVCVFVNDNLDASVLQALKDNGVKLVALRCAGYNNVDISYANSINMPVVRVPAYSPHAIAEHAVALIMTLNRKTHLAYNRVKKCNFTIDGLLGFDLYNKTAGVIGSGKIGQVLIKILLGFGMNVLVYDPIENPDVKKAGARYVDLNTLFSEADIISLHCPLSEATTHLINQQAINKMKDGVMIINTSRGQVLDSEAVLAALESGKIGYLGIDVYEHEAGLFFNDCSDKPVEDKCLIQLQQYPNVLITGHQAFFTEEAMNNIVATTLQSISDFEQGKELSCRV